MNDVEFHGVKIALITPDKRVVVLLRDNKPGLRFAGRWDLPGGGREDNETPVTCALREVKEELSIDVPISCITLQKIYPSLHQPDKAAYFMIAELSNELRDAIVFGGEGQRWQLMPVNEFIAHTNAVPDLQDRLKENISSDTEQGEKSGS